jgi:Calcineurin-like phosphoesterase.
MVAVVGDIHGCFSTFRSLLNKIWEKYPGIEIYSVGDLVDRGRYSKDVVEFFRQNNFGFCIGNHEQMFFHFVEKTNPDIAFNWIRNGYEATLFSYEKEIDLLNIHVNFIKNAPLYINLPDCFISHAGIGKNYKKKLNGNILIGSAEFDSIIKKDVSEDDGIVWTREELLDIGKLQVVGHSRKPEVVYKKENNSVYIDTSAFTGNGLSAVIVEQSRIVEIFFEKTVLSDI